jgi:tetratricopeptide (TPR) repeat protein
MVSDLKGKFYKKAGNILDNPRRFVGRDSLILEVHHLLDSGEQVLLAGMGGIGKTALAAHIAADRIDAGKGPVIWLEAGEEDADTLFEALARTFDQHQRVAGTIGDERVTVVRELLAEKQAMLVLDNVWNERALFRVMRAIPPGMAVLVTSRHMIPLDGVVLPVSELGPDHALALLTYHARQDYRGDDKARLLCRRLGYHPFALEIAGKQLKVQPHLSPGQLLANIGTAPHTLTIPGAFADAGRAGLQDVLDSSVKELDDAAYGVFVGLGGLFVPVATIELLAMLLQSQAQTVQAALVDLQQRGLAEIAQPDDGLPHYRVHDLTYSYARTLFEEEGCDRRTAVAAVQHYVFDHAHDFDHLDFEQANILGAARAAKQLGDDVTLIAIMWVMLAEGYLDARGHTPRLLKRADDAIAAARQMQPDQDETLHFMLGKRGNAYADRGDLDRALEMYQSALELAPNPRREAILLSGIGTIRIRQGEDDYDHYFEQAEQIATTNHDDVVLAQVLEERGTSALFRGEYEVAYQFLDRSVVFAERLGDVKRLFLSLYNLGVVEVELGHFTQALSLQKRSHQIAEAANNSRWIASALSGAARAYHGLGERDKAQTYFRQALRRYQEFGATDTVAWILEFMQKEAYPTDIEDQIMADS